MNNALNEATFNGCRMHGFRKLLRRIAIVLAAVWIFGGSAFYYIRFTSIFYHANKAAILNVFQTLYP